METPHPGQMECVSSCHSREAQHITRPYPLHRLRGLALSGNGYTPFGYERTVNRKRQEPEGAQEAFTPLEFGTMVFSPEMLDGAGRPKQYQ